MKMRLFDLVYILWIEGQLSEPEISRLLGRDLRYIQKLSSKALLRWRKYNQRLPENPKPT